MSIMTIDLSKCRACGLCTETCPIGVFQRNEKKPPQINAAMENYCIRCGHCAAICSNKALTPSWVISPEGLANTMRMNDTILAHVEATIKGRRSVREYTDKSIENATIERLIEVARYAPTAGNTQLVHWLVVNGRNQVRDIAEHTINWAKEQMATLSSSPEGEFFASLANAWAAGFDPICRGATALVATYSPPGAMMSTINCTLAIGYFDLLAHAANLGTCWAGFVLMALEKWQPLKDALGLEPDQIISGMLMLGVPKYKYQCIPERNPAAITWKS
jgi:nitroreductase/NAD-dependent dihydropyrimidine dehydrogenase PreA subunit